MQFRLSFAAVLSLAVVALAKPPARINQCCPKTGPENLALIKQKTGPFAILCSYEQEKICYYIVSSPPSVPAIYTLVRSIASTQNETLNNYITTPDLTMPPRFSDSPNARSKSITTVELDTNGILNRHATKNAAYQIGVSESKGTRRTMEDAHSFVVDFDSIRGQGFFAVFDGHAGKHAAEWCGSHFHESLLSCLHESPTMTVPDVLNQTFHKVDEALSKMCEESEGKIHSGCTAVTAFLRIEDADGHQSFLGATPSSPVADSPVSGQSGDAESAQSSGAESNGNGNGNGDDPKKPKKKKSSRSRIKKALKSLAGATTSQPSTPRSSSPVSARKEPAAVGPTVIIPPATARRRVLYSANAGDARAVLCRAGKAVRLTYDHKGSDKQEAKRITDAGGFVMSGRVNGVLAVTRSLGDSSMKEFVVGAPYTTETELCEEDEFLVLACDGLWDVVNDQGAIDLVRKIGDAQEASKKLLEHALAHHTTDNVTVVIVRFKHVFPQTA
ncbi:Protein phosphatase 2C 1 [Hypsizygus marmoreus]|uniref:Protein phosphatase 2C 1 n=1 Tax=Hypsizygus marmoreus TaxID=39966 RepID=A0A369JDM5_HYPMA|nr:Protein phosphatase 2C 1 [Hypsizygus marmoreus]